MSQKKKTKRKKSAPTPKNKSKKPYIILLAVVLAAAAVITTFVVMNNNARNSAGFYDRTFKSVKAYDASGDEAELQNVYNVRYDSYQGSMSLKDDGTFTFWMTPGSADDGTHGGTYTYNQDKDIIKATFGSGEKADFKIKRKTDGSIDRIEVPYQGYTVYMR